MTPSSPLLANETVHIDLASPTRHYDIIVGENLLGQAGDLVREHVGIRRCLIVTDATIAPLFLKRLEAVMAASGHDVLSSIVLPAGEQSKSFTVLQQLLDQIFERAIDRGTLLVALGGGVVGDLVGFTASITLRGLDFVQIPTTLLAQVDSSVGGKTGINSSYGKNTVGTFYQPRLVIADVATLDSLPERETMSGYAEVVKYGLIHDPEFFSWCLAHGARLLLGDAITRIHAVRKSCAYKADIVASDEREAGARALLNLGHTFAHPLESVTGYSDKLLHGEAVSIGMVMAFALSVELGLCPVDEAKAVHDHLLELGLPVTPPKMPYDVDELMSLMTQDKKAKKGELTLILAKGIGKAFIADNVDRASVRKMWQLVVG